MKSASSKLNFFRKYLKPYGAYTFSLKSLKLCAGVEADPALFLFFILMF